MRILKNCTSRKLHMTDELPAFPGINTLNEKSLHAALKQWYAQPGDPFEVKLDGYFIDLIHGDLLVEIQTGSFHPLKKKLHKLCESHPVRLVFPIPQEKWIVMLPKEEGGAQTRRRSPRKGRVEDLFSELIYLPGLMAHDNFSLEVLMIQEEEVRRPESRKGRRRKEWVTQDRKLISVLSRRVFQTPADLADLLPTALSESFTVKELAKAARAPVWLARRTIYCLKALDVLTDAGKRGNARLYQKTG